MAVRAWLRGLKQKALLSPMLITSIIEEVRKNGRRLYDLERRVRLMQEALGRIEGRQLQVRGGGQRGSSLISNEFRVFSQWGEDGIIQHLCRQVPIERKVFVEFGVENYEESNTRFLLVNDNWSGLVIDGDVDCVEEIRRSRIYWLHNLKAAHAFITRDNINELLKSNGITGEIGLLSIDIDGMDYWIWDAITVVEPAIVVAEYNHRFGRDDCVTVPYDERFERRSAHPSLIYYGASLKALCRLAERKGYAFVGCGSAGLNAFFVRRDLKPETIPELTCEEGYVEGRFCEVHDAEGRRTKISAEEERKLLRTLPLVQVEQEHPEAATV